MHRHPPAQLARTSLPARILVTAALLLGASLATASVVEIAWDEEGHFEHVAELSAGGFAEVCGPLSGQERVQWAFDASAALDFNIHYHEGDEVVYPATFPAAVAKAGELVAPIDQTYCWMWTSSPGVPATVTLRLTR